MEINIFNIETCIKHITPWGCFLYCGRMSGCGPKTYSWFSVFRWADDGKKPKKIIEAFRMCNKTMWTHVSSARWNGVAVSFWPVVNSTSPKSHFNMLLNASFLYPTDKNRSHGMEGTWFFCSSFSLSLVLLLSRPLFFMQLLVPPAVFRHSSFSPSLSTTLLIRTNVIRNFWM